MESMSPECTPLKTAYDSCFQNWYTTKFLKHAEERADQSRRQQQDQSASASANSSTSASIAHTDNNLGLDECDELFKAYKGCVMKAVKEREIDDLLADARKETPFETYGDQKA